MGVVAGKTYEFTSEGEDNNFRNIKVSEEVTQTKIKEFTLFHLREQIENIKASIISLQAEQTRLETMFNEAKLNLGI